MQLDDWREAENMSYENLGRLLNMTTSKVYRLCTDKTLCVKLVDAVAIVKVTDGKVSLEDLLTGDC